MISLEAIYEVLKPYDTPDGYLSDLLFSHCGPVEFTSDGPMFTDEDQLFDALWREPYVVADAYNNCQAVADGKPVILA